MDLNRWKVFRNLDPAVTAQVKLAYTWGPAKAAFFVLDNDDVYCIGSDDNFILDGRMKLRFPRKVEQLCGAGVVDFQAGENFMMVLTRDGKLYDWVNDSTPNLCCHFPQDTVVTQIAAGISHSMALTSCGEVFAWGRNDYGQIGNRTFEDQVEPWKIIPAAGASIDQQHIIAIACGKDSSFAVGEDGNVWAWGKKLEVGNGVNGDQNAPKLILEGKNITKVACSSTRTLAVSKDFTVYYWIHSRAGGGDGLMESRSSCNSSVVDVGSSVHSDCIAFSTAKSVWVVGEWLGTIHVSPAITSCNSIDETFALCVNPTMCRAVKPFRPSVPPAGVMDSVEAMFDDTESSDVDFIVDGQVIHAHKGFLRKRSAFFARMFGNDWKESSAAAVNIESYSYIAFRSFLHYLYTGRFKHLECNNMLELLKVANYYQEEGLLRQCEQLLKLDVKVENACLVYSVAAEHNAEHLKHYVLDFARPRFMKVANSDSFASLANDLKTQLTRELVCKRKLVKCDTSYTDEEEEASADETDECFENV